jgi:hypothetical protein
MAAGISQSAAAKMIAVLLVLPAHLVYSPSDLAVIGRLPRRFSVRIVAREVRTQSRLPFA